MSCHFYHVLREGRSFIFISLTCQFQRFRVPLKIYLSCVALIPCQMLCQFYPSNEASWVTKVLISSHVSFSCRISPELSSKVAWVRCSVSYTFQSVLSLSLSLQCHKRPKFRRQIPRLESICNPRVRQAVQVERLACLEEHFQGSSSYILHVCVEGSDKSFDSCLRERILCHTSHECTSEIPVIKARKVGPKYCKGL